ncbi:glucose-6-phosphate dehydrogenase [Dokdonella ginsengisoli]|uniref:Glucose-6-phosphate 1-dehydrogenase n=1 Tax=Dokdonella ginsengisoli TaxID=363846 RepID=A0ABV9QX27_9GAMM
MHDTLLLFGATGDLAARQLFPSLLHLLRDRLLPEDFRIVAVARHAYDDEAFRAWLGERLAGIENGAEVRAELLRRTEYVAVDLSQPEAIAQTLRGYADGHRCVSYLATPPYLFVPIAQGLKGAGLLEEPSRLVLEKPIGSDLESARAINAALGACLGEDRIFRIDHYLGKAAVQNLLALRFGNTLLEAVWHHRWIESVDILVAETAGVDGRESYYADYGALRDMVQNHVLQLLCLIAMEPPASLDAAVLRDEKLKVLRALRPFRADSVLADSVRGRYEAGLVDGEPVRGFSLQAVQGREPVETFVALRASIDNWRWAGVPFRLCTGKRLAERVTQVVVTFRPTSHWLFEKPRRERATPNRLVLRLQPQENVELELMSSLAGPEWGALELQALPLDLSMPTVQRRIAYERLLLDALNGNSTLFVRSDEVEAAWTWIDSIIAAWREAETPILPYMAGSWGPAAAANFLPQAPARTLGAQRDRRVP